MLTITGLGDAGVTEKQIFDCFAGSKPVSMLWTNIMKENGQKIMYQNLNFLSIDLDEKLNHLKG